MGHKPKDKPREQQPPDSETARTALNWIGDIRSSEKYFHDIAAAYDKLNPNDPFALFKWLTQMAADSLPPQLLAQHKMLLEQLREDTETGLLGFDAVFRDEARRRSWRVDGQWPTYYLEYFLRVEICAPDKSAKIGDRQLGTLYLPAVVATIDEQFKSTAADEIDVDEFVSDLSAAYDRSASTGHRQPSIWAVYKEFLILRQRPAFWRSGRVSAFRAYDEQRFRAAFTKMMQRDRALTRDGREMRVFPPIKAEDGMFLYLRGEDRHTFVGRIEFLSASKEAQ
jgi:hypothetical protein